MFGCLVAGRLLQTNLQQVDETHAAFELPAAGSINHICVFLLGTVPFPVGYGATVHFFWPGKGFQLLGMLSNEKPSAIFRLRGTFNNAPSSSSTPFGSYSTPTSEMPPDPSAVAGMEVTAVLGLSIEPLSTIEPQIATLNSSITVSSQTGLRNPTLLAERVAKHLFNYISGFIPGGGTAGPESLVPLSVIARWYENFIGKVKAGGVGFLERGD